MNGTGLLRNMDGSIRWVTRYAGWSSASFGDDRSRSEALERAEVSVCVQLHRDGGVMVEKPSFLVSRAAWGESGEVVVAEVRAILLRHPNPFPPMRLFRWLPSGSA